MKKSVKTINSNNERPEPYLCTSLVDFNGEEWRDIPGYDGIYSVSNYGRVKSESRYLSDGRYLKGRVLKQKYSTVNFSVDGIKKTGRIMELVGMAFLGEKEEGFVYCHKNKIKTDNRLQNIIKVTQSESAKIDFKIGVKIDWGIGDLSKDTRRDYEEKHCIYEDGVLVRQICTVCLCELPIDNFSKRTENNYHRMVCKECRLKGEGVKDIGKLKRSLELAKSGLRYCNKCKVLKSLDTDFNKNKTGYLGKAYICKACNNELSSIYRKNKKSCLYS